MDIRVQSCVKGQILPLSFGASLHMPRHSVESFAPVPLPVGTRLLYEEQELFSVVGRILVQDTNTAHARYCPLLCALQDIPQNVKISVKSTRTAYALAWITLSDKGSQGQREDKSGPLIGEMIRNTLPLSHEQGFLLPDDAAALRALLLELALGQGYDIICTTGGTGLVPRDVTQEAMATCIDSRLYGF